MIRFVKGLDMPHLGNMSLDSEDLDQASAQSDSDCILLSACRLIHYENTPIQIY